MNILMITADDLGADTPGCFGGPADVTPHLDGLAAQGTAFDRAHVAAAVCQPSRAAMMTGLRPHRNGVEGFTPLAPGVPVLPALLGAAGYRCGVLGKTEHLQPAAAFAWDTAVDRADLGTGRDPAAYAAAAARFVADAGAAGRPWFLLANSHDPHRPFAGSDEEQQFFTAEQRASYPPPSRTWGPGDTAPLPGFLPALPGVEQEYREYLGSVRRLDDTIGALLAVLDASGAAGDTVVVFVSDHGIAFPFAKANCYVQSTRTPLVVRWPGLTQPGSRVDGAFVSAMDLFPTLCAAAGVPVPAGIDGRSLLPLLRGEPDPDRSSIVTAFHETSAGQRFEMRCHQDTDHAYVWNAWSDGERAYRAENMWGRSWAAMEEAATDDPALARRTAFYRHRTVEELYDLRRDPHACTDRTSDPAYRPALDHARSALLAHLVATGDPLAERYRTEVATHAAGSAPR